MSIVTKIKEMISNIKGIETCLEPAMYGEIELPQMNLAACDALDKTLLVRRGALGLYRESLSTQQTEYQELASRFSKSFMDVEKRLENLVYNPSPTQKDLQIGCIDAVMELIGRERAVLQMYRIHIQQHVEPPRTVPPHMDNGTNSVAHP